MNHSPFRELVRKDLVLYRNMMLATLAVGALAVFMITRGPLLFYLGSITALCSFIILSIFLVQSGILMERKQRVHHFVLSLPITGWQYMLAKLLGLALAFLLPFVLISGASLLLIASYPPSRGFLPFATTVLMYFPMYFAVLISVTATTRGYGPNTAAIIFFNVGLNLFIAGLLRTPSVGATIQGSEAIWPPVLLWVLAIEFAVAAVALALALRHLHSKTDYL
jgi:hypothetical protein